MGRFLQIVAAVIVGNILTLLIYYAIVTAGVEASLRAFSAQLDKHVKALPAPAQHVEIAPPHAQVPPPPRPSFPRPIYEARVPIPGHPIEKCVGPNHELNEDVQKCTRLEVITIRSPRPITNNVEEARAFLREQCESKTSMSSRDRGQFCGLYRRITLYGNQIRVQPGVRVQ
jgi:hypothetical protein